MKREAKVDLALLGDDEAMFEESGSGALVTTDGFVRRLRADQMARHSLLDERIQSIDFFLVAQNARLRELEFQQRWEQFSILINIGRYILIIVGVLVFMNIIRNRLLRRIASPTRRYAVMKMFSGAVYAFLIVWLLNDVFAGNSNILTSFAILGAGITFAMQDIVKNLLGWLIIIRGRSFSLGQRVAIGPHMGDVVDIGLLHTTLLEVNRQDPGRSGNALVLPNAKVLTEAVLNQNTTSDFVVVETDVCVKHGSDWRAAEKILQDILHEETHGFTEMAKEQSIVRMQKFFFSREPLGATVFINITDKGIAFTLHFLVPIGQRGFIVSAINRKILDRFAAHKPPIVFVTV
jgi:small-conductance mechanosensitive channel